MFGIRRITQDRDEAHTQEVVAVLEALETDDVGYETTSTVTAIEAEEGDELLAAAGTLHEAVPGEAPSKPARRRRGGNRFALTGPGDYWKRV